MNCNEISNAYFNIVDVKRTVEANEIGSFKRVHGGSDNEETLLDLIDDLHFFLTELDKNYGVET